MSQRAWLGWVLLAAAGAACTNSSAQLDAAPHQQESLASGVAARVGDDAIELQTVQAIASAQSVELQQARDKAVFDALMAKGARARGFEQSLSVQVAMRGELARALLAQIKQQAQSQPISDQEVAKFTALHWMQLDRPAARRTVHAVVRVEEQAPPAQRAQARAVAEQIAKAVRGVVDEDAFIEKAKAVSSNGLEVVAEKLPPISADGRVVDLQNPPPPGQDPGQFDRTFARAVFEISKEHELTGPVATPFGMHVIMLTAMQPEHRVPLEERRQMLRDEILAARAREQLEALTAQLRQRHPVEVERNAGAIMALLPSGGQP